MQVSTKSKMELRSKLIRIAAAAGLALAIGSFGVATASAADHRGGGNRGAAAHQDNGNRGSYRGGGGGGYWEAMAVTTTRLSRITTQRLSLSTMAMHPS